MKLSQHASAQLGKILRKFIEKLSLSMIEMQYNLGN